MVPTRAAGLRGSGATRDGLRPTNLARDLGAIAELIELCFGKSLDSSDLASVREMKAVGALGPLLWLLEAFDTTGLGLGFVWMADGRLVGNVSTYRAGPGLRGSGPGWLIANVAVHPDRRRRGVARALMEAALDFIVQQGGRWVVLQLEHDNLGARALYESLGFKEVGCLTQWVRREGVFRPCQPAPAGGPVPRPRRAGEWEAEMELAARDRVSGLAWTRPLAKSHFKPGLFAQLWDALSGRSKARWVVDGGLHLLGSLWVETGPFEDPRLTLLLEPSANQVQVGCKLVQWGLSSIRAGRRVRLEASNRDPAFAQRLEEMGFQARRTLTQMLWLPQ